MKYRILVLMIVAVAAAWAGPIMPCQAGTVASVIAGGGCSIGPLVFTFTSYQIDAATHDFPPSGPEVVQSPGTNGAPDASSVAFDLLGTPTSVGFRLTAPFWSSGIAAPGHFVIGWGEALLNFSVATADGNPVALLISTAANGALAETNTDETCGYGACNVNANATSALFVGATEVAAGANQNQFAGQPPEQVPYGVPPFALVDPFSSDSAFIHVGGGLEVQSYQGPASAFASLDSADYWFTARPLESSVPEPGTWALVGMAGIPFVLWRARRAR